MSADLTIYAVAPGATNIVHDALALVLGEYIIGDRWEPDEVENWTKQGVRVLTWDEYQAAWDLIGDTPQVTRQWVGQVSWLKAGLMDDSDLYIPGAIRAISNMLSEPRVLTLGLLGQMMVAFNLPDRSIYSKRYLRRARRSRAGRRGMGRDWARCPYPGGRRERDTYSGVVKPRHFRQWANEHIGWTLYAVSE